MLIIGNDGAIVYENVCLFYIGDNTNISSCEEPDNKKTVSLCASMNSGKNVDLNTYETKEEAKNVIKSIGYCVSKKQDTFTL